MIVFQPRFTDGWVVVGSTQILIDDDIRNDEDLFFASWNGWTIWLDGGRTAAMWQVSLVAPGSRGDGAHDYVMRDFVDTTDEVQAWIDRACRIAKAFHEERAATG